VQIVGRKPNKDPGEVEAYAATMAKVGDALTAAAAGLLATPNAQVRQQQQQQRHVCHMMEQHQHVAYKQSAGRGS
jgi:hypothetical protein